MTTTDRRPRSVAEPDGGRADGGQSSSAGQSSSGGRHAKPDGASAAIRVGYVPRHAKPATGDEAPTDPGRRVRVVLAERRDHILRTRTLDDVEEQTPVGQYLVDRLMKTQLGLALRLGAVAAIGLGALPVLFATVPEIGQVSVVGIRLPWLLLGVLAYAFLLVLGWMHTRAAERNERDFADLVED